jgi:hypothetical protein
MATHHSQHGLGNLIINKEEGLAHNFDVFSGITVEKAMKRGYEHQLLPISSTGSEGPYEFHIPPSNEYIFFPHTRLYIKGRITKSDGTACAATDNYSGVNLFPQTLFKQVDVKIGDTNTSYQDQLYPYKAYFETLLSYGANDNERNHLGACSLYIRDDVGNVDGTDNSAYEKRKTILSDSKLFDFSIPLHADIMQSVRVLPPNIPVRIILTRNNDEFSLMTQTAALNLKIEIRSIRLYIRKIEADPTLYKAHQLQLLKAPIHLPFTRCILKKYLISQNSTNAFITNVFKDVLPRQVIIGLVDQTRVDGRKKYSPFYFEPAGLNYINLKIDGQNYPANPYQPDFAGGLFCRELRALYDNIGIHTTDSSVGVSKEEFKSGTTLFAYDLTPDMCNGWHIHDIQGGSIDLEMSFSAALTKAMSVIVYASFETAITIDKDHHVSANFNM